MQSRPSFAKARPFSRLRFSQYSRDLASAVYKLREGEPVSFLPSSRTIPHPVLSGADNANPPAVAPSTPNLSPSALLEIHLASAIADLSPPTQPKSNTMSITGAAPVTLSIKQMIEQSRVTVKAAHEKLTANAGKVQQAADALSGLGDDLGKEGDDLLAMVGQYKNDLGS